MNTIDAITDGDRAASSFITSTPAAIASLSW
jgi:hypothetical protein